MRDQRNITHHVRLHQVYRSRMSRLCLVMTNRNNNRMCQINHKNDNQQTLQRTALLLALLLGFALAACSPASAVPTETSSATVLPTQPPTTTVTPVPTDTPQPSPTPAPTKTPGPTPFGGPTFKVQAGVVLRWNTEKSNYDVNTSFPQELLEQVTEIRTTATNSLEAVNAAGEIIATAENEDAPWEIVRHYVELPGGPWINELVEAKQNEYVIPIQSGVTSLESGQPVQGFTSIWVTKHLDDTKVVNLTVEEGFQEAIDHVLSVMNTKGLTAINSETGQVDYFPPNGDSGLVKEITVVVTDRPFKMDVVSQNGTELTVFPTMFNLGGGFTVLHVFNETTGQVLIYNLVPTDVIEDDTSTETQKSAVMLGNASQIGVSNLLLPELVARDFINKGGVIVTDTEMSVDDVVEYARLIRNDGDGWANLSFGFQFAATNLP